MSGALAATHLTPRQPLGGIATSTMIDYFALAVTHALIFVALLRIISRDVLDDEAGIVADAEQSVTRARNRRGGRRVNRPVTKNDRDA